MWRPEVDFTHTESRNLPKAGLVLPDPPVERRANHDRSDARALYVAKPSVPLQKNTPLIIDEAPTYGSVPRLSIRRPKTEIAKQLF